MEQKPKGTSLEHQASFTVGMDQIEGCEQELNKASEKSIASEKVAVTRSEPECFSRNGTVDKAHEKDSQVPTTRIKVLDRRRTVSEGDCHSDCQSSNDSLHPPELVREDSSPPRIEYKERSLEECKLMLKQPVCLTLVVCYLTLSDCSKYTS